MSFTGALRARDPRSAARSLSLILLVCAVTTIALASGVEKGLTGTTLLLHWTGATALLLVAVGSFVVPPEVLDRFALGTVVAVVGTALIAWLNLLTADTSAAAQVFFSFPVLWAASHLRATAVLLVTVAALVGDGLTVFLQLPAKDAVTDFVFFGAVLTVMAWMLLRATRSQERLVAALQDQARRDSLTGLVNRRVFDESLEETLIRRPDAGVALVLIDVDAFKTINDSHGHPVGDDVLVHLAGILREQVRAEDAVLSRLGGDELAVLLPGCTAPVAARRAQELLDAVRGTPLPLPDGDHLYLSISLGVAHIAQNGATLRTIYASADAALYEAKRAGRGRVAVATA